MRLKGIVPVLLALSVGACGDDLLDIRPVDRVDTEIAITDASSAEAALVGAYATITNTAYFGGSFVLLSEIMSDNAEHTGTFATYADAANNDVTADNGTIEGIWNRLYNGINRVNVLIQRVPELEAIEQEDENSILGQAHALRALFYFDLMRSFGGEDVGGTFRGVPLVLEPPLTVEEASQVSRASGQAVYDQILADLSTAETMLAGASNSGRTFVTPGFIDALQAKVHLYLGNWAQAEAAAEEVRGSGDYSLVNNYGDLFTPEGSATSEDIFRGSFTATDFNNIGYYYRFAGRFEQGATQDIYDAYDQTVDQRWGWNFDEIRTDGIEVAKFPTTIGAENVHVIRYAEVLLILAEAHARQGELGSAIDRLNEVRERAGLTPHVLGVTVANDQNAVLEEIWHERRLELAFEGDRWFDLVRTGLADAVLPRFEPNEALWPIPQQELDVAPNLDQNPGY